MRKSKQPTLLKRGQRALSSLIAHETSQGGKFKSQTKSQFRKVISKNRELISNIKTHDLGVLESRKQKHNYEHAFKKVKKINTSNFNGLC